MSEAVRRNLYGTVEPSDVGVEAMSGLCLGGGRRR